MISIFYNYSLKKDSFFSFFLLKNMKNRSERQKTVRKTVRRVLKKGLLLDKRKKNRSERFFINGKKRKHIHNLPSGEVKNSQ